MRVIGLTGNMGAGKSSVSRIFERLGAFLIDADAISHRITQEGGEGYLSVVRHFGRDFVRGDGALDRAKLAALVFSDARQKLRLERILLPRIKRIIVEELQKVAAFVQTAVIDAPLLFSYRIDRLCSEIWVVTAPHSVLLERIAARDGLSPEQAEARVRSQIPQDKLAARADVVIANDGNMQQLERRVLEAYHES